MLNNSTGERLPEPGMFYEHIRNNYGNLIIQKCKEFSKVSTKLAKSISTKSFLIKCRNYGLVPDCISNNFNPTKLQKMFNLDSNKEKAGNSKEFYRMNKKIRSLCNNVNNRILNILIRDKCVSCTSYKKILAELRRSINSSIEKNLSEYFFTSQDNKFSVNLERSREIQMGKFDKLKKEMLTKMGIKLEVHNEWFVNLSDVEFPDEVKWLLALGKKFAITHNSNDFPLFKIIADVENYIGGIEDMNMQNDIRSEFCGFLGRSCRDFRMENGDKFINSIYMDAKKFLTTNKDIIVTQADKGGKTVVMIKSDYDTKLLDMITDRKVYRPLRKDITFSNQTTNNELAKLLFDKGLIDEQMKRHLTTYNALPPRIYGLPKIHKERVPLRPIVSSINSPVYNLSRFLTGFLKQWTHNSPFNVKNSFDFRNDIADIEIGVGECLVSFDVVSLFTSVPIDHFFKLINDNWESMEHFSRIPKELFLKLLKFCLVDGNYFLSNDKLYRQVVGAPMGGPLSPIVADIVMEDLLKTSMNKSARPPRFIKKYVDDIFAVMDRDQVLTFQKILNGYHDNIRFTYELEERNCLPFLDLMVMIRDGRLVTNWYRKPTASGRIINYHSCHPRQQILNTAKGLISRVLKLSHTMFHKENIRIVQDILEKNSFPKRTIHQLTKEIMKKQNRRIVEASPSQNVEKEEHRFLGATFVPRVSAYINRLTKRSDSKIRWGFSSNKNLGQIFPKLKGKIDKSLKSNVVYKIPCKGTTVEACNMSYIGTTKQFVKNRMANHKSDINLGRGEKSALAQHCVRNKHRPGLEEVKIICTENNVRKRLILESLHIQASSNTMNVKQDVENVHRCYGPLVTKFNKLRNRV